MRAAVVGHVEWVTFTRVPRIPAAGEIVHALDTFDEAAGGGAVAAVQLARLVRRAHRCTFFTALGDDPLGRAAHARLRELGVDLHVAWRDEPTRRALVHLDSDGERAITVVGDRMVAHGADPLPWDELARADAVYFTGGDAAAAAAARRARALIATPRAWNALAGVEPDALVWSGGDADESGWAAPLRARARVRTAGARGGAWETADSAGTWAAAAPPGPAVDAYGCGDSFAAGLTLALGEGRPIAEAVELGARCGAACLTGRGPYGAPL